tara:strand:- start:601 stop:915 length:315 start_codon:yes stop_codon:yes gene_type:complete
MNNLDSSIIEFSDNNDIYKEIARTDKISQPYLTKYEYAKIIGISAQQIESGRKPLIDKIPSSYVNPIDIATYELEKKKTPIIIKRKLPNNVYEYFTLDQLNILH